MKLRTAPFLYKFILVIILAAIFGWLFCYFGIYIPEKKRTQDMLLMCIESDLNTARMLRKNDSTNLLNKVENKIKNYPGFVKAKIGITPEAGYYLLMIQDYLVRHGVHASDDIKSILANVPNEFRYTTPLEISDW